MPDEIEHQGDAQAFFVEEMPGGDVVARLIDLPRMYTHVEHLIWGCIFEFPQSQGESVVWSKYAPIPDGVHNVGCGREREKCLVKPDFRYAGYISAIIQRVTEIRNARGHGFLVVHEPSPGVHHAEIRYFSNPQANEPIKKADKTELKALLQDVFSDLVPHACRQ
ncbi:hypothetical protein [Vogesella oryzae]|uniref:hypothetical protein n=1 Tax=Vogesella oryzae TaxID=1735285 RepID=UPI0015834F80|nr:hypothetical protein [Vogesella oryzae]